MEIEWTEVCLVLGIVGIYVLYIVYVRWKDEKQLSQLSSKKTDQSFKKISGICLNFSLAEEVLLDFTLEELHQFDGIKNQKVYIGCKNRVFDVSNSCNFSKNI